jgi:hypothetical protein
VTVTQSISGARFRAGLVSLGLCALALWLGASALSGVRAERPLLLTADLLEFRPAAAVWQIQPPLEQWPVYYLDQDGFPYLCGHAWPVMPAGSEPSPVASVIVRPFASLTCRERLLERDTLAAYPAWPQLVWGLLPEAERGEVVSGALGGVQSAWHGVLTTLQGTGSQHAAVLIDLLQSALFSALRSDEVAVQLTAVLEAMDPAVLAEAESSLWTALRGRTGEDVWDTVVGWPWRWLASEPTPPRAAFGARLLRALIADERAHAALSLLIAEAAKQPASAQLSATVLQQASVALLADPRLGPVIEALLADEAAAEVVAGLLPASGRASVEHLARELPGQLLRHRHPRDHNPLVTHLARDLVRGRSGHLLIALDAEQHRQLEPFSRSMRLHRSGPLE